MYWLEEVDKLLALCAREHVYCFPRETGGFRVDDYMKD